MWVVLVVALLNRAYDEGKVEAMKQKLCEVPSDLDELFWTILNKNNSDKHETILMLQWVLFAVRPLSPEELYYATLAGTSVTNLGSRHQSRLTDNDIQRRITNSSKGLITVLKANRTVQFIHESVKDFLLRNKRLQSLDPALDSDPIGKSHDRLRSCCVSFIEIDASVLGSIWRESITSIQKYPFLEYASTHWLDHAEAAEAEGVSQREFLKRMKEGRSVERLLRFHAWSCARCTDVADLNLLYISLSHGHNSVARILLEHVAEIRPQGWGYDTALRTATSRGSTEMMRLLLIRYGADPNHYHKKTTPLHVAITNNDLQVARVLLEHGADANALNADSDTALHLACHSKAINNQSAVKDIMKLLLEYHADINARCGGYLYESTVLHHAVDEGKEEIVRVLLGYGPDVNAIGGKSNTPLQGAILCGNSEIAKLLLMHGADVNARGGEYDTALQAASLRGNNEIAKILLERGAEVHIQGGSYGTALQASCVSGYIEIAKLLLDRGADVNIQGGRYGTALQAATVSGNIELVKLLLEHGADVNAKGGENHTALQAASVSLKYEIVKLLLERGAYAGARGGKHGTALIAALMPDRTGPDKEQRAIIKLLLTYGVNVNARGGLFGTALQVAERYGYSVYTAMLLRQHGATSTKAGNLGSKQKKTVNTYEREELKRRIYAVSQMARGYKESRFFMTERLN